MAMARSLSRTRNSCPAPLSSLLFARRRRSGKAQIFEIDLAESSSSSEDAEKNPSISKLEEVVQNIIVRRAAPDWLPFSPGSSYYVPPPSQNMRTGPYVGVVEVLGRLSNGGGAKMDGQIHSRRSLVELLSRDDGHEGTPVSPSRSWPSYSYFNEGISPLFPVEGDMEVEVKILDGTKSDSVDEDEDKEG